MLQNVKGMCRLVFSQIMEQHYYFFFFNKKGSLEKKVYSHNYLHIEKINLFKEKQKGNYCQKMSLGHKIFRVYLIEDRRHNI